MNKIEILEKFKRYLNLQGINSDTYFHRIREMLDGFSFEEINQDKIEDYFIMMKLKHEPTYVNSILTSLRAFKNCFELDINIPKSLKTIKKVPYSIDLNFLEKDVVNAVEWSDFNNPKKVKAVLYLLFYTGMRSSEVYLLKREAFDLKHNKVKVYLKKTQREKIMLYPVKVKNILIEYFETEDEKTNAFNMGKTGIKEIFLKLQPCFPNVKFHPHMFKKSAVTHLHSCGFSVAEIAEMVGITVKTLLDHYLDVNMDVIEKTYKDRIK